MVVVVSMFGCEIPMMSAMLDREVVMTFAMLPA
jgi:hypothetical protein